MNHQSDARREFDSLLPEWQLKARSHLRARRIQDPDCDDLIQNTVVAYLEHMAKPKFSPPENLEKYLWRILYSQLSRRCTEIIRKHGHQTPDPPEPTVPSQVEAIDIMLDLPVILKWYKDRCPTQADAFLSGMIGLEHDVGAVQEALTGRAFDDETAANRIIGLEFDLEAAATSAITTTGGDPHDAAQLQALKRRISSYRARFSTLASAEFPEYSCA